jgi:hypothetical protein
MTKQTQAQHREEVREGRAAAAAEKLHAAEAASDQAADQEAVGHAAVAATAEGSDNSGSRAVLLRTGWRDMVSALELSSAPSSNWSPSHPEHR